MKVNFRKIQFMSLSRRCRMKETDDIQVEMNGEVLQNCEVITFLGVIVDRQLSWKLHVQKVWKKCLSASALMFRVDKSLPGRMRGTLYRAMVQPHLDYCCAVWGECSNGDMQRLERIQKIGMRYMLGEKWDYPSEMLRRRLGWMTLHNRRRMTRMWVQNI